MTSERLPFLRAERLLMKTHSNRLLISLIVFLVLSFLAQAGAVASAQGLNILDAIVQAHGGDVIAPISVQIAGVVERNGKTEPFRLVATRDEELRIEYGTEGKDTMVASQKLNFHDNGTKFEYSNVPSGFSQLDITGLFFVQQLRNRAVRVEVPRDRATVVGIPAQRVRVESERSQEHYGNGRIRVDDRVDLYIADNNGMLLAVSRTFYDGRPDRYTQTFVFSDYRKTEGAAVLPYKIEIYTKTKRSQLLTINSYQFNVPTEPGQFFTKRAVQ